MFKIIVHFFKNKEDKDKVQNIHYENLVDVFGEDYVTKNSKEISTVRTDFKHKYIVLKEPYSPVLYTRGIGISKMYFYNISEEDFSEEDKMSFYHIMLSRCGDISKSIVYKKV